MGFQHCTQREIPYDTNAKRLSQVGLRSNRLTFQQRREIVTMPAEPGESHAKPRHPESLTQSRKGAKSKRGRLFYIRFRAL